MSYCISEGKERKEKKETWIQGKETNKKIRNKDLHFHPIGNLKFTKINYS